MYNGYKIARTINGTSDVTPIEIMVIKTMSQQTNVILSNKDVGIFKCYGQNKSLI